MSLLSKTQELCQLYNLKPKHSHGQNFLITEQIYEDIVVAAKLVDLDNVLEVGPGLGFLTTRLAQAVNKVTAVELDAKLFEVLNVILTSLDISNIDLINQNVLDFNPDDLPIGYKIVANLPYNITSVFLRKFLNANNKPDQMTLMLQKEVAERIVAKPGSHSMLSLSVQFYADPEIMRLVDKTDFWPAPKVNSAVLSIKIKPEKDLPFSESGQKDFFRLLKFGFSSKRKMLKNNLAGAFRKTPIELGAILGQAGFKPSVRAQELSLLDWQTLFAQLKQFMV